MLRRDFQFTYCGSDGRKYNGTIEGVKVDVLRAGVFYLTGREDEIRPRRFCPADSEFFKGESRESISFLKERILKEIYGVLTAGRRH